MVKVELDPEQNATMKRRDKLTYYKNLAEIATSNSFWKDIVIHDLQKEVKSLKLQLSRRNKRN